ncbi:hypothetical protein VaNZ11_008371 [Volvox africanus]|uniref:THIF-type NAD/FAD binding fold domain-containing protein n=1 Tax=Volvox africanus TaxID=51714 RepID=A0ABQ5S5A8_9CHLO|nr:hypothetical protein VaNZ11_008371 [Volvox africanus]
MMHLGWRPCFNFRCKGAASCAAALPTVALPPVHTAAWLCPTQIRHISGTQSGPCFSNPDTFQAFLPTVPTVFAARATGLWESVTTGFEPGQSMATPVSNGDRTSRINTPHGEVFKQAPTQMVPHGPKDSSPDSTSGSGTGAALAGSPSRCGAGTDVMAAADAAAGSAARENQPAVHDPDAAEAPEWLQRTTLLLGRGGVSALHDTRVLLVGLGGVGSYVAEFLVRAGVGSLAIVDGDVVDVTNKNRQLPALDSTIGLPKAHVMSLRLLDINSHLNLVVRQEFLSPDTAGERLLADVAAELDRGARAKGMFTAAPAPAESTATAGVESWAARALGRKGDSSSASAGSHGEADGAKCSVKELESSTTTSSGGGGSTSTSGGGGGSGWANDHGGSRDTFKVASRLWVVDCIDSVAPKLALVAAATRMGARVMSSMGAGGRMDPLAVQIADISETYGDPFAATCRRGLRRQYGIRSGVTVIFSTEPCRRTSMMLTSGGRYKRSYYGTISFIPALFGLQIAAHIVNEVTGGPMMASEAAQRQRLRQLRYVATGGKAADATCGTDGSSGRARAMGSAYSTKRASSGRGGFKVGSAEEGASTVPPPPPLSPLRPQPDARRQCEGPGAKGAM